MKPFSFYFFSFISISLIPARAVEKDVSGVITYNTTAPTNADILNWTTGWGANDVTGWNYAGAVNGASGVYLRNNWVITAAHVGAGPFTLSGTTYTFTPGSARTITNGDGTTADVTLFQLTLAPNLPSLAIATSAPTAFSASQSGSSVAMLGYGGGQGETWGLNTVTKTDIPVQLNGYPYITTDFETAYGTTTKGSSPNPPSVTNDYVLVVGDSGGGDFIYDSSASAWKLSGLNEAVNGNDSYMVQMNTYASQINGITAAPEPSSFGLFGLGLVALLSAHRRDARIRHSKERR